MTTEDMTRYCVGAFCWRSNRRPSEQMLCVGRNEIDGIPVEVIRKRIRRINLRIAPDGTLRLSLPDRGVTLAQGEAFLKEKWDWALKARREVLARPPIVRAPVTEAERAALSARLDELNATWAARFGERDVTWRIRKVTSVWGCCHWSKRYITYNEALAHAPRELVEYVVVHELTHFAVHGHGPAFYALMDARLPGWKDLRERLNRRDWERRETTSGQTA